MAGRFNVGDHVDAIEVKNRWAAAVIVSVGRVAGYRVRFDGSGKEVPVGGKNFLPSLFFHSLTRVTTPREGSARALWKKRPAPCSGAGEESPSDAEHV